MTTEIEIETETTGGEVAVEVGIGMIVTDIVRGTEIIAAEVEAGVSVLITLEAEAEAGAARMMMTGGVAVDQ